jgi:hypothetical protein
MRKKSTGCSYLWIAVILLIGLYLLSKNKIAVPWLSLGLAQTNQSNQFVTPDWSLSPLQGLSPTLTQVQHQIVTQMYPVMSQVVPRVVPQVASDTIYNAYAPPLRYNDVGYRQIGYLNGPERLPLFGRSLRYDKWYYYTIQGGIKLPIEYNRRKCTVSPGCDSVSDRDTVLVDGQEYTVNLYEMDMVTY